jgi:diguanylate cyclase (GGDEF)-like protein
VNDTFGHDAGNRVLRKLAEVMSEFCLSGKFVPARLGGEEFAIYIRDTDIFKAQSLCESLRAEGMAMVVPSNSDKIFITISIGVVEIEKGVPFENSLKAADRLLYMAKANGRNRVYSSLTVEAVAC